MMRDICARFKYSECDVIAATPLSTPTPTPTLTPTAASSPAVSNPGSGSTTDRERSGSEQSIDSNTDSSSSGGVLLPDSNGIPMPVPTFVQTPTNSQPPTPTNCVGRPPTPMNCPPRDLIHRCLRRYYREMEDGTANLAAISERMEEDLAPYSVLKIGGFSLGNIAPKLLATVLIKTTNLRTLDLGFNRINDRGATLLAKALEQNKSLQSLYLSGNDIGPLGAAAIAAALAKNNTLHSLHLSGNNIGEEGAQFLAKGLEKNTSLRSLYIGTNGIGANGMQSLAEALQVNQHLEELTLGQNKIGSGGLKLLAAAFATGSVKLTTLEVGKNGIDAEGVISFAKALCNPSNRLQNLYMDNNPIGDIGAGAFGAVLSKNAMLRVLDLSYTQMSLLGLRDLSMGLSYSGSLLCLLLDGHDWASTQFMKKTNALNGMTLSAKGASNFAASCIVGAINSNAKSVLYKLTGVDLALVVAVASLPLSPADRGIEGSSTAEAAVSALETPRRPMDLLTRNERILKHLQATRALQQNNKRKSVDVDGDGSSSSSGQHSAEDKETAPPQLQRQKTNPEETTTSSTSKDNYQRLTVDTSIPPRAPLPRPSPAAARSSSGLPLGIRAHPSRSSLNGHQQQHQQQQPLSLSRLPSWPVERRLSVKSPRYESTMEVQVRKVISDIHKMPFNSDEYAALQTFYLGGGCHTTTTTSSGSTTSQIAAAAKSEETNATTTSVPQESPNSSAVVLAVQCPACRASRIAQYPQTMVLKTRLEIKPDADKLLLVLLRQLHYLVGVFQHIEFADAKIDALLVSTYD